MPNHLPGPSPALLRCPSSGKAAAEVATRRPERQDARAGIKVVKRRQKLTLVCVAPTSESYGRQLAGLEPKVWRERWMLLQRERQEKTIAPATGGYAHSAPSVSHPSDLFFRPVLRIPPSLKYRLPRPVRCPRPMRHVPEATATLHLDQTHPHSRRPCAP
jgi:hypothetical protein